MEGEHVLGALPVQWHELVRRHPMDYRGHERSVTVARLTPAIQKQAVDAQVQEQGGGFLKRMAVLRPVGSGCMSGTSPWTPRPC